ncbi:citrate-binding protein-like [Tripterygium wilfordii]|uniref:Citrate-binding protein-like n=1 Tax=Tripterygium wilfordii TaxID=458696 RepID=A0A7J7CN45_TRIWF|nr:citrate-binding protein-like [Tripterygium wilfordii]
MRGLLASQFISYHADPTDGFTSIGLTKANFEIQRPYNIPVDERYQFSFNDGVRRLWVYASDKPHALNSHTQPRTEIKIRGLDYSSGIRQFEGNVFVLQGTSGATIFQIFGAPKKEHRGATTMMLVIDSGNLRFYDKDLVASNVYDRWFRLNVIHDVSEGRIVVFIDGVHTFSTKVAGKAHYYFKFGVYASSRKSHYMESRKEAWGLYKPYDVPREERYSFKNKIQRLWVYANDKPYSVSSPTQPRTEQGL